MSSCIEFKGSINKRTGYGSISRDGRSGIPAHRYFYEKAKGKIPEGMVVMHICDNRSCVNVEHLKIGTQSENILDCVSKGRNHDQKGEKHHGSKLTDEAVVFIKQNLHLSNQELANRFNVAKRTISDVRQHKTWRHING
ncbi:MAG: HNH endonuclease signature motif containing protein [Cetobacterium sp.]|uniref:HNH endonuclease signature motif containing protein n=1 Tax=Cetobacterium sp. TaxID=2071632 RepID=UPI003EE46B67